MTELQARQAKEIIEKIDNCNKLRNFFKGWTTLHRKVQFTHVNLNYNDSGMEIKEEDAFFNSFREFAINYFGEQIDKEVANLKKLSE